MATEQEFRVPVLSLLRLAVPAAIVGIGCALTLYALSRLAGLLEGWIWDDLSAAVGVDRNSALWIIGVLTAIGLLIGLVIRYVPGHAGPDPATQELVAAPLGLRVLPGLALALVLMLAGGVSLGPENPIIGINVGLAVALGLRFLPKVKANVWLAIAVSGTIGAMFGTPVAAALLLSELDAGDRRIPLWDRLFAPLVAATAGALTMLQLEDLDLSVQVPAYTYGGLEDLGYAIVIAVGAAAVGLVAVYLFVPMHRLFLRIGHPVLMLTAGGLLLGLLGALGGEVTLFKGLSQMQELPGLAATTTALGFLAMAGIKLAALLVAATSGFRGGRIFPALFVGVALGFAVHTAWDTVPLALAVGAAVVGIVVAATRNGWLSLFMAVAVVPQVSLLVGLVLATLAAWLVVTNRPPLLDPVSPDARPGT
ncbi:ion channel protein [Cellulomonas sp. Root137]|uniref:ion channel protein n=1 Tax=Cellulomonas sp. Root137 TaxID=1736459 RepID=UPI0006F2E03D|nr:ion channel protein [Cellulomonas sp. Root137]KQY46153.1 ion channel protein [Cellulomonas sp. Root137]KRD43301.1 ion channel protein [Cellulomonas sp. Root930]